MVQFQGFICDSCEDIIPAEKRTRNTVRFEGETEGEFTIDLCPKCVQEHIPSDIELRPLRRRRKSVKQPEHPPVPTTNGDPSTTPQVTS